LKVLVQGFPSMEVTMEVLPFFPAQFTHNFASSSLQYIPCKVWGKAYAYSNPVHAILIGSQAHDHILVAIVCMYQQCTACAD